MSSKIVVPSNKKLRRRELKICRTTTPGPGFSVLVGHFTRQSDPIFSRSDPIFSFLKSEKKSDRSEKKSDRSENHKGQNRIGSHVWNGLLLWKRYQILKFYFYCNFIGWPFTTNQRKFLTNNFTGKCVRTRLPWSFLGSFRLTAGRPSAKQMRPCEQT